MGANCSTSTHYHNNICATIVHVCKLHQYCLVAVQKVLRGAQSIWIHLSNCKNCPQQSLQLQWAHAPHSYVHFFFEKKVACLSTNVFSILSIFVFFQLQIHLYNNQQLCWHCAPPFLSFYAFPPFSFQCCCFFRSLERPLESVCYRAQSVKVPSCKVCEVCSVCMYVNLYLCLYMCIFVCVYVCIRVCLCLCMFIYMCTASV